MIAVCCIHVPKASPVAELTIPKHDHCSGEAVLGKVGRNSLQSGQSKGSSHVSAVEGAAWLRSSE